MWYPLACTFSFNIDKTSDDNYVIVCFVGAGTSAGRPHSTGANRENHLMVMILVMMVLIIIMMMKITMILFALFGWERLPEGLTLQVQTGNTT